MKRLYPLLLVLPILLFTSNIRFPSDLNETGYRMAKGEANAGSTLKSIKIWKMEFNPKRLVVEAGTTVRWFNKDSSEHDITSGTAVSGRRARQMKVSKFPDGKFQSGLFGEGETFELLLTEKGEYTYFCNEHSDMQAVIVVR